MESTKYLILYSQKNTKDGSHYFWNDIIEEHPLEWLQRKIGAKDSYVVLLNWEDVTKQLANVDVDKLTEHMSSQ